MAAVKPVVSGDFVSNGGLTACTVTDARTHSQGPPGMRAAKALGAQPLELIFSPEWKTEPHVPGSSFRSDTALSRVCFPNTSVAVVLILPGLFSTSPHLQWEVGSLFPSPSWGQLRGSRWDEVMPHDF